MRNAFLSRPVILSCIIGTAFFLMVFIIMAVSIAPAQHDLNIGDISPVTITANKDIEDTVTHQRLVDEAVSRISKNRIKDESIAVSSLNELRTLLDQASAIRTSYDEVFAPIRDLPSEEFLAMTDQYFSSESIMSQLRGRISVSVDDQALMDLARTTASDFSTMRSTLINAVNIAYNDGVQAETIDASTENAMQVVRRSMGNNHPLLPFVEAALTHTLTPNVSFDEAKYEADVANARESIEPPMYLKGQNIVIEGEQISEAQHQVLLELGYLRERVDITMYIGLAAIVMLLCLIMTLFLVIFEPEMLRQPNMVLLLCSICLLHVGIAAIALQFHVYAIPLQLGILLIAILIKPRLAMVVNFVLTVMIGIIASGRGEGLISTTTSTILIIGLIGGCQAVYLTRRPLQRAGLFLVGIATGLIDMAVLLALGLMTTANIGDMLVSSLFAALGGFLSGLLAISLMPIFESIFHLITPPKLLELSNPHQPLLKRLLLEAPGTYHHAIMVANLAEAAVEKVGGNALLTRVAAYYHDVGKLKRPYYFGENQLGGENPHDRMEPLVSAATLIAHTTDGAALAEAAHLPTPIIDIILQHHGTSATRYFYAKAVAAEGEENVDIDKFRYGGPNPQTIEAAVVMLADGVEAGVRSLKDRSSDVIDAFVHKMIKSKLEEGVFDFVPLTLRDFEMIAQAFIKVLQGMYHERVAYPDIEVIKHAQRT